MTKNSPKAAGHAKPQRSTSTRGSTGANRSIGNTFSAGDLTTASASMAALAASSTMASDANSVTETEVTDDDDDDDVGDDASEPTTPILVHNRSRTLRPRSHATQLQLPSSSGTTDMLGRTLSSLNLSDSIRRMCSAASISVSPSGDMTPRRIRRGPGSLPRSISRTRERSAHSCWYSRSRSRFGSYVATSEAEEEEEEGQEEEGEEMQVEVERDTDDSLNTASINSQTASIGPNAGMSTAEGVFTAEQSAQQTISMRDVVYAFVAQQQATIAQLNFEEAQHDQVPNGTEQDTGDMMLPAKIPADEVRQLIQARQAILETILTEVQVQAQVQNASRPLEASQQPVWFPFDAFWFPDDIGEDASLDDSRAAYTLHLATRSVSVNTSTHTGGLTLASGFSDLNAKIYSQVYPEIVDILVDEQGDYVPEPWRPIVRACLSDTGDVGRTVRSSLEMLYDEVAWRPGASRNGTTGSGRRTGTGGVGAGAGPGPASVGSVLEVDLSIAWKDPKTLLDKVAKSSAWRWMKVSEKASRSTEANGDLGEYVKLSKIKSTKKADTGSATSNATSTPSTFGVSTSNTAPASAFSKPSNSQHTSTNSTDNAGRGGKAKKGKGKKR